MMRSRISLVALGVGTLIFGACGSDDPSSSDSTTSTSSSIASSVVAPTTTSTTVAGGSTVTTAPGTATTSIGAVTTTTAASTGGATTTTVAGRVVTDPADNVKLGDSGEGVTKIQFLLKSKGFNVSVDGDFGNQTDAAVKAFQRQSGLTVDGVVGRITWTRLSATGSTATTAAAAATTTTTAG